MHAAKLERSVGVGYETREGLKASRSPRSWQPAVAVPAATRLIAIFFRKVSVRGGARTSLSQELGFATLFR